MSRHHQVHTHEVSHVVNDIHNLPREEAERIYGIELKQDGSVFDPTYLQTFATVGEWADFSFTQDEMEYSEDFGRGKQTLDDCY